MKQEIKSYKCPECGADLTQEGAIDVAMTEYWSYQGTLMEDGNIRYHIQPNHADYEASDFGGIYCSECGEELLTSDYGYIEED